MKIDIRRNKGRAATYEIWMTRDNVSQRCLGTIRRVRNGRWQLEMDTPSYGLRVEPFDQFKDAKARALEYWQ